MRRNLIEICNFSSSLYACCCKQRLKFFSLLRCFITSRFLRVSVHSSNGKLKGAVKVKIAHFLFENHFANKKL